MTVEIRNFRLPSFDITVRDLSRAERKLHELPTLSDADWFLVTIEPKLDRWQMWQKWLPARTTAHAARLAISVAGSEPSKLKLDETSTWADVYGERLITEATAHVCLGRTLRK